MLNSKKQMLSTYSFLKNQMKIAEIVEASIGLPKIDLVRCLGHFGHVDYVNSVRRFDIIASTWKINENTHFNN